MKILKFFGKFLSVILSFVISFICLFIIVYLAIDMFIRTDNLNKVINVKNILTIKYENSILRDDLINSFMDIDISKDDAEDIIESDEFNDLFDDYLNGVILYYFNGGEYPQFSTDKLDSFLDFVLLKNNTLSSYQKDKIKNSIIDEKDNFVNSLPSREEILSDNFINDCVNFYNSISIYYFIGSIIIIMFLIFIFTWSLYKPFKYVGISLIVPSILFIIVYFFRTKIIGYFNLESFFNILINNMFYQIFVSALILFGFGMLFIILYSIINKFKRVV